MKITKDNFQTEVLDSKLPVLVDFWAAWCGPCRMVGPLVEEIEQENEGVYKVGKVNVDEEPELAAQFQVFSIPTMIVFKNGAPVNKSVGAIPKDRILELLK